MKRTLAFLCALALMLSLVPGAAFAATQDLQAEIDAGAETIVLEADASNVTISRDTTIDLNGHDLSGVTVLSGTLYLQDSQTADYTVADGVYGHVTGVTGAVKAAEGYLQVGDSFHAVNLDIYAMTLRATDVGVYYKSHFAADEIVAAQVESFGVALSVVTAPNASNLETYCGYSDFTGFEAGEGANSVGTSTLLKGIMKAANGDSKNAKNAAMPVYGRAYIKTAEGYFFGETVKRSLQEQVEAIDKVWNKLTDAQKTPVLAMLEGYTAVMENWNIPNIRGIQVPGADADIEIPIEVTAENGIVTEAVTVEANGVCVTVPAGTKLAANATGLTVLVTEKETSEAGLTLEESEVLMPMDVHVEGLAADNTAPLTIYLGKVMAENLNMGNYAVYHVENGKANEMVLIPVDAEFTAHNQYKYSLDGELTLYMATFSEVAIRSTTTNTWNGGFDYTWFDASKNEFEIRNADQLAAFGAIVGGMAKDKNGNYIYTTGEGENAIHYYSFSGKTIKLLADIDLGDSEKENDPNKIFYPIGYYNSEGTYERTNTAITSGLRIFEGTFDGNGHTVSNFYHNTWEMKGDHDWYSPEEQYYRDGMGLFGRVYKGTVKNLTVRNFKSDGEIATTGVIAAYADGATFENIAIFDCNPRVYNIGNGGIVGCVGWYAKEANLKTTFKNITVDNSNKISALWGSYDVPCGGIVGQYYPTSGQTSAGTPKNAGIHFDNCHISAQMDVYNDVCANYQYYAYRYAGILLGSVRENVTIDGHSYPKMDDITASGCTVHFGTWNDYYYCELVDNTTASYTHDYQMSRLVEIKAIDGTTITYLDGTTATVPASGRANYVIVDYTKGHGTENATCYHFLNGDVWTHEMGGIQTGIDEDGDGEDDLREDKQHIYREFNNLVTGYGWGVTTKAVGDLAGVTILDRVVADSVEKFAKADNSKNTFDFGAVVTIGELFKATEDGLAEKTAIIPENVMVAVSPKGEGSTAGGIYTKATADADGDIDWTKGTLEFTGAGDAIITITDYYFCTPTTITVTIKDKQPVEKFAHVFPDTDTYLYRIGNMNEVGIDKLFKLADDITSASVGTVSVTVTDMNGNALDVYTAGNGDWDSGNINFKTNHDGFTGPVIVTITDNDYCIPTVLHLEVVTAENKTSIASATANNVVLLNDVSGSFSVSGGYTVYGNGFTVTLPTTYQASYTAGFVGYVNMTGGNLDNVRIVGPVYPEMNIYQSQSQNSTTNKEEYFYNSVYIYGGNNTISNSYISGSRTAVCIRGANSVTIENTTLSGGAVANLQIEGANTVTLRNLTTEQKDETDSYGKGVTAHGMGVLVGASTAEITIEGELNQHNWLSYSQWKAVVGGYESSFPYFYTNSKYAAYQHTRNEETYVNIAFIFACDWDVNKLNVNDQVNKNIYEKMGDVTVSGYNGGVYSVANQKTVTDEMYNAPDYVPTGFNPVAPVFDFDNAVNHDADDDGNAADTYCVYNAVTGIMAIGMTTDSRTLDISGASVEKDGEALQYTAYLNGTQVSGRTITVSSANGTKQTLTFKASSTNKGYDKDGNEISGTIEYSWTIVLEVAVLAYPAPVWNMGDTYNFDASNSGCYYVYHQTSTGYAEAVPIFNGIKVNYYDKNGNLVKLDLSGRTTLPHNSTQAIKQDFTITLDDGSILTMNATGAYKSGVTNLYFTVYQNKVYAYPSDLKTNSWVRPDTKSYEFNITFTYQFTDPNGLSTEKITVNWYDAKGGVSNTVQWKTFDKTNGEDTCIVEGTMMTMADGTQKAVEDLKIGDMLLVFNHVTGKLEAAPLIFNTHDAAEAAYYDVLNLQFSDGEVVKIVSSHGFFDMTLMQYVYITNENYKDYIGHEFYSLGENGAEIVTLTEAFIEEEFTRIFCPVTYFHMNSFANGMLNTPNIPGDITGLVNYFEYDPDLKYNEEAMQRDIEKYGLYTYDDFKDYISEEAYHSSPSVYLKVAVGKGMITYEQILDVIFYLLEGSLIS